MSSTTSKSVYWDLSSRPIFSKRRSFEVDSIQQREQIIEEHDEHL